MRHRSSWHGAARVLLSGLLGGFLGCDSGTPSPINSVSTTGPLITALAQAFCARQEACSADAGAPSSGSGSSCQDRAAVPISEQLALVSTAAAEGLLAINLTPAQACIDSYQNQPCGGTPAASPNVQDALGGCAGAFTGFIPVGERCDMTPECAAGSFCLSQGTGQNVASLSGSGSLGVCFPYQEMGQACNSSADCDPSLLCDGATLTCVSPAAAPADAGS